MFDDEDDDFLIQATNDEDTMASDDDMTNVTPKPTQPLFSDDDGGEKELTIVTYLGFVL